MRVQNIMLTFFILLSIAINAQDMAEYNGNWQGKMKNSKTFSLDIEIENLGTEYGIFKISGDKGKIQFPFNAMNSRLIQIQLTENQFFKGILSKNGREINGFLKSGLLLYHLKLSKSKDRSFIGLWNVLMIDELKSLDFYLSVENGKRDEYQAYPILGDNRFTGTWCGDFQKKDDIISFHDFKTGLRFKGKLASDEIQLDIFFGDNLIAETQLKRSATNWKIGVSPNKKQKNKLKINELENLVLKDSIQNTHAILVSRDGKMIYENYFNGYNANIPHDTRSASKSISSAIVGIAKDKALFKSVDQSIFDFLAIKYQILKDSLKAKIDIKSLLTMSSGLDAIDYGINANPDSPAVEDNYQRSKDWIQTILSVSMINTPNTNANYGSANPYLLGIAMDSIVSEPLELFMDENLFQKLEISNYIVQTDLEDNPYFGGGMYLTPNGMLKFGELYLNNGKWKSKRILSEDWVKQSFATYRVLENTNDKNGYGYLWWHNTYNCRGKSIESIEARGAGGQYIFVIPSLKAVVVITSGNFRNGKTQQPEMIFEKYILPSLRE